ncbi:MAG: DedA family protein [Bacteroidetes bacterium]|nr:DedA family protein [Bacteroidota bacterium]
MRSVRYLPGIKADMGDLLVNIVDWMSSLPPSMAYLTILGVAYLENLIPPIPGDMLIVFGGYMAGMGLLNPWLVVLLATLGGSLGFLTMYGIGYKVGQGLLDPTKYKWLPKQKFEVVREKLQKWGFRLVAANRFLSGLRSVISLTVGMAHMSVRQTAIWCTVSALVWTALIAGAGYYVGENWGVVGEYLRGYGTIVTSIIVLFVLYQGVRALLSRKNNRVPS